MTTHDDRVYIYHILQAIDKICQHLGAISYEDFLVDDKTSDAVIRQFMVIGEAANKVSDNFKENHSNIPWYLVIGMRNQLVHGYFSIDLDIVWSTAKQDLQMLKEEILLSL